MLTPFDDYPIHASAAPIAHPASADPNHYDRYWFNGMTRDGSLFLAGAMGHYPVRNIVDAAFSVIKDGVQYSLFTSGRMPADRSTVCGPVRVEVIEPLKVLRLVAQVTDGLGCDLTFRHRTEAIEEPRQWRVDDGIVRTDHTRLTQWGTWRGPSRCETKSSPSNQRRPGLRDRSWGIRPVGEQLPQNRDVELPQVFWLWAPMHFDDAHCISRYTRRPTVAGGSRRRVSCRSGAVRRCRSRRCTELRVAVEAGHPPGTDRRRWPWTTAWATAGRCNSTRSIRSSCAASAICIRLGARLSPRRPRHRPEDVTLAEVDPTDFSNVHIQNIVRARLSVPMRMG